MMSPGAPGPLAPDSANPADTAVCETLDGVDPDDPYAGIMAPQRIIGQVDPNPPSRYIYYHLDHLGSPRLETDAAGAKIAEHHYLPFGDERPSQADPTKNTRAFTGHERDDETGLDYMLARYYGSSLGRFESPDPGNDTDLEDPQSCALAKSDPRMKKAIKNLKKSDTVHTITGLDPNFKNGEPGTGSGPLANTQPQDSTTHVDAFNPATVGGDSFSPLEQLGHEVSHMEDAATGTRDPSPNPNSQPPGLPNNEVKGVRLENKFRPAIGSPIRTTYGPYTVPDPTADPTDPWP
jgi:RHS repeat-associated protein